MLRPQLLIVQPFHGGQGVIVARVLLHGLDLTVLDARDGQNGAGAHEIQALGRAQILGDRVFGGRIEHLGRRLQEVGEMPARRVQGPITSPAGRKSAGGHRRRKDAAIAEMLVAIELLQEGRAMEQREAGTRSVCVLIKRSSTGHTSGRRFQNRRRQDCGSSVPWRWRTHSTTGAGHSRRVKDCREPTTAC